MSAPQSPKQKPQRGLTLIEIVVTLAILGVLAALVGRPIVNLVQSRLQIGEAVTRQADIDFALSRMATQIRQSDRNGIKQCGDGSGNGRVLEVRLEGEDTVYELQGTDVLADANVLVENVDGFACNEINADLRLYVMTLNTGGRDYEITAFKRVD